MRPSAASWPRGNLRNANDAAAPGDVAEQDPTRLEDQAGLRTSGIGHYRIRHCQTAASIAQSRRIEWTCNELLLEGEFQSRRAMRNRGENEAGREGASSRQGEFHHSHPKLTAVLGTISQARCRPQARSRAERLRQRPRFLVEDPRNPESPLISDQARAAQRRCPGFKKPKNRGGKEVCLREHQVFLGDNRW